MSDPRHVRRIKIVQNLFSASFNVPDNIANEDESIHEEILKKKDEIDKEIQNFAPRYPLERISRVDLAILRLAVFELMIEKQQPQSVIIDEAVRLAKEMGGNRSYAFINAVLGAILKELNKAKEKQV